MAFAKPRGLGPVNANPGERRPHTKRDDGRILPPALQLRFDVDRSHKCNTDGCRLAQHSWYLVTRTRRRLEVGDARRARSRWPNPRAPLARGSRVRSLVPSWL